MKTLYTPIFKISFVLFLLLNLSIQLQAAPLSGTYTINPNGSGSRNVKTFNDAVQLLKDSGVNGAVVFNVADGKYSEQFEIIDINGASATNNITFQSASNDSTKAVVDFKSFGGSSNYTLFLNRCKYFNFNRLTFLRSDAVNSKEGRVIQIFGSTNIGFNGCRFLGIKTLTTSNTEVIRCIAGLPLNKNINFQNNIIRKGIFSVYWMQKDSVTLDSNIAFLENTIDSSYRYCCDFRFIIKLNFIGNTVNSISGIGPTIDMYQIFSKCLLSGNRIFSKATGAGMNLNRCDGLTDSILVTNNMISTEASYTFVSQQSYNLHIYYNSFYSLHGQGASTAYITNSKGSTAKTYFKNNICQTDSGYSIDNQNGITQSNYNNLFTYGKYLVRVNGNGYLTLTAYKFGAGMDLNSVSYKPRFISSTNLHLNPNPNNIKLRRGTPISFVATDIDGQIRDKFSPTIGADEMDEKKPISSIAGRLFIDYNDNGKLDSNEYKMPRRAVKVTGDSLLGTDYSFTDDSGNYFEYIDTGKFTLSALHPKGIKKINPASNTISIKDASTHIINQDFGLVPSSTFTDLSIHITPYWPFGRPGSNSVCTITAINNSLFTGTKIVSINLRTLKNLSIDSASIAYTKTGDSIISITFGTFLPMETKEIRLYVKTKTSAKIGESVILVGSIVPTENDSNIDDNKDSINRKVRNSEDPNDKAVSDSTRNVTNKKPLTYTVRFQNTGNDVAYDVIVKDKLDVSLNPESFSMITTSHPCKYKIVNKELVVTFSDINLPDSHTNEPKSHGLFKYQITPYNISNGTKINNTAYIYFDYNSAVVTNTVSTLFLNTGIEESVLSGNNNIHLYPNPTTSITTLQVNNLPQTNTTISLEDILGRQLMQLNQIPNTEGKLIKEIDVSALPKGMYFISVINEEMRVVSK
ncbi:MAG: T9SS type A sorting domain-containing protein, partial [Bacteroidetes bacterium]|nr:T9SS type A sorting domain-containing protein [Bacteroidota bacterium]